MIRQELNTTELEQEKWKIFTMTRLMDSSERSDMRRELQLHPRISWMEMMIIAIVPIAKLEYSSYSFIYPTTVTLPI